MIIVSAAAVGMILLRGAEISQSEDGLWPSRASIGADTTAQEGGAQ